MKGEQSISRERSTTGAARSNFRGYRRMGQEKWVAVIAKDPLFVVSNYYLVREGFENRNLLFNLAFSSLEHRIAFKHAVSLTSYVVIYLLFMSLL